MIDVHRLQPSVSGLLSGGNQQRFLDDLHGSFDLLLNNVLVTFSRRHIGDAPHTHPDDVERCAYLVMCLAGSMRNRLALLAAYQLDLCLMQAPLVLEVELLQLLEWRQAIEDG